MIYVASRVKHADLWRDWRAKGAPILSTWIDEAGEGETADMGELWHRILLEVMECTSLVFYAEPDDFPHKGALVEVGMALALGKPVMVCLPGVHFDGVTCRPVGSWIRHHLVTLEDDLDCILSTTTNPGPEARSQERT